MKSYLPSTTSAPRRFLALNNERAQTIPNVNVIDVVKIGSREFLVITPHGLGGDGKGSKGYVDLSSVRSILPALKFERR
ncbi:MAG: hypothetical protein HYU33_07910 [Candidatus Omnitrophica bacterium]|nr:hypothetical protein [Candidatus Omnitrophota bacterium]